MTQPSLPEQKLEAEFREADARFSALQADAEARHAKEEMDEIAGVRERRERAQRKLDELKRQASENLSKLREETGAAIHDLQVAIERVSDRFPRWDAARERRFEARINEALAKLKAWEAQADRARAEAGMKGHDLLADLRKQVELARARLADWRANQHDRKAQEALADADQHLDKAFDAAASKYDR